MADLADKAINIGVGILVLSIVVGSVAIPTFLNVSTTGMTSTQSLTWGSVLTIALVAGMLIFIYEIKKK